MESMSLKKRKFCVAAVTILVYAALVLWFLLSSGGIRFAAMLSIIIFAVFVKLFIRLMCKIFKVPFALRQDQ